jgi:acyl carrier protein
MSDDLKTRLRVYVHGRFPAVRARNLSDDAPLLESGAVDSLGVLALAEFIQEELGIELVDDDLDPASFRSIASIAALLEQKQQKKRSL